MTSIASELRAIACKELFYDRPASSHNSIASHHNGTASTDNHNALSHNGTASHHNGIG
ncbi:MAG: hypothetical protein HC781_20500 [Leptolyngbyaceae cyanobacterium CSU_1_4]|nr:hypothetical protein [Leptolyngbyaceae cyanobacterium CSU_1_4]